MRRFRFGEVATSFLVTAPVWVVVLVLSKVAQDWFQGTLSRSYTVTTVSILFGIACVAIVVARMQRRVELLFGKLRLSVKYFPGSDPEKASRVYQVATDTVALARPGAIISAVNSYVEVRSFDRAPSHARRRYLEAIERLLGEVEYRRLIQVRAAELNADQPLALGREVNPDYLAHYQRIIAHRDSRSATSGLSLLDAVPAIFPTSFVIIENPGEPGGYVIWQMNEHAPDDVLEEAERLTGIFIIDDQDGELVQHFKQWFNFLWRNRQPYAVALRDLTDRSVRTGMRRFYPHPLPPAG